MNTRLQTPRLFSLEQAVQSAPSLAALQERVRASQLCLANIEKHIPQNLRAYVKAGPIAGDQWCLLVINTAASTKLRQLLPTFISTLSHAGLQVRSIRIKVQTGPN